MISLKTASIAALGAALTLAIAQSPAEAGGRGHPQFRGHWAHSHGGFSGRYAWRDRRGWDRRLRGQYAAAPFYGDGGYGGGNTVIVNGAGNDQPAAAPPPEPGYVYRSGRAADGSYYANEFPASQPYAPPVIYRIR